MVFDNLDDPKRQALLMLAAGLLSPTQAKGGAGVAQALSRAIPMGLLGYNEASQNKRRNSMEDMQRKLHEIQLANAQKGQAFDSALSSGVRPAINPLTPNDDEGNPMPSFPGSMDFSEARAIDPIRARQAEQLMAKPMRELKDTKTLMHKGQRVTVNFYKDGSHEIVPYQPEPEKLHFGSSGDRALVGADPITGEIKTQGVPMGISPDTKYTGNITMRGQNLTDSHFRQGLTKPQLAEGPQGQTWLTPPSSMSPGSSFVTGVGPKMSDAQRKDVMTSDATIASIDQGIEATRSNPSAFGFSRGVPAIAAGRIGESIAGRSDTKEEAAARSFVFNNVSSIIKERAGTAQSVQEMSRVVSFLPSETDSAEQIVNKFNAYKEYEKERRKVLASPVGSPPPTASARTPSGNPSKVIEFSSLPP